MSQLIIALGYRARAGKDTVGAHLVKHHGFARIAFADIIRDIAGMLTGEDAYDLGFKDRACVFNMTGGQLMQSLSILRKIDPDIFIKAALPKIMSAERAVITDCRFLNEATALKKLGALLVKVDRPGLPTDMHISEQEGAQIKWDAVLGNNGDLIDLYKKADRLIALAARLRVPDEQSPYGVHDRRQAPPGPESSAETAGAAPQV